MSVHTIYRTQPGKKRIQQYYEDYLAAFPKNLERQHVHTRFGSTHVLVSGPSDGKPVFIFQGGNCINPMTLSWFKGLFQDYRVYAPDTIGHPGYSAETRISAKDDSFALWIRDLMDHFGIQQSAFIGPSYGAGIILRLAAFQPERIACSILVSPSGMTLGPISKMIRCILLPMLRYRLTSSGKALTQIADAMSCGTMKSRDAEIIGEIFRSVRLEQEMPKITEKMELERYGAPTLVIAGSHDIFFPANKVIQAAHRIMTTPETEVFPMGHFPSDIEILQINDRIKTFLESNYT
ncbi:alpha/beta hydrolase [Paenibacillus chibensis]|uniref:Alpha/beta hydrolase n=1 Tax=Paenibacillus chibensis TaxID=59846 RepID=A0ABU6PR26_9BACL|nr:alpha/beta hydrolase [Paenibacillus chibensis]